jgi:glycosyltransferase involved in cell wall biosynthesis
LSRAFGAREEKSVKGLPRRDVALLTAGRDKPYALGLAAALVEKGIPFEFLGSNDVDSPQLHNNPLITFRNPRGDQAEDAPLTRKAARVLRYYSHLVRYAVSAQPRIFHILWNNKFEWFDRTLLMLLYRVCGRRVAFTAHNVNMGSRDGDDSFMNRFTLKVQYKLADHIFVHTDQMSRQLQTQFHVPQDKISVIPFGVNSTVPDTALERATARLRFGLSSEERVLLFFGNIAPYKGLEYLVRAMARLPKDGSTYRLLIAGRLKCTPEYWHDIQRTITEFNLTSCILPRIEYIPDDETELYFKAADALVLPYTYIFQSGVLFLGYNFGLPVLASDVGSLRDEIVEGETGLVFRPRDPEDLARTIERFFQTDLYRELSRRRRAIRDFAAERYSWSRVASITSQVYTKLLSSDPSKRLQSS